MKIVRVIDDLCIGCGVCESIAPDIFEVDGISRVLNKEVNENNEDTIMEAVESCPTGAIEVVEEENKEVDENNDDITMETVKNSPTDATEVVEEEN